MIPQEYCRTAMLIGENGVHTLQNCRILLFGLGGVGSYTAEALARAGVGSMTLVDGDRISLSNINRQLYALHSTVGRFKTEVARERISDINPDCRVNTVSEFVTPDNLSLLIHGDFDYCIDAIDDTAAKTAVALYCNQNNIPLIASMGTGSKLNPMSFEITDITKTQYCPLCRVMRKKYKEAGLSHVTVLFSKEQPLKPLYVPEDEKKAGHTPPSSISFVPSVAGLMIAGYVINGLIGKE